MNIVYYVTDRGESPYLRWLDDLQKMERYKVTAKVIELARGQKVDCKYLNGGVWELRTMWRGKALRVYYASNGDLVLLLGGGKRFQKRDIVKARNYWKKHNG